MNQKYKDKYSIKTKFEIDADDYVVMREPTYQEYQDLISHDSTNTAEMAEISKAIFRACLVDHNFINEDESKCSIDEVFDLISSDGLIFSRLLGEWIDHISFRAKGVLGN